MYPWLHREGKAVVMAVAKEAVGMVGERVVVMEVVVMGEGGMEVVVTAVA